jgi:hypothetical protein
MGEERVALGRREMERLEELRQVEAGRATRVEAARRLKLSVLRLGGSCGGCGGKV